MFVKLNFNSFYNFLPKREGSKRGLRGSKKNRSRGTEVHECPKCNRKYKHSNNLRRHTSKCTGKGRTLMRLNSTSNIESRNENIVLFNSFLNLFAYYFRATSINRRMSMET